MDDTILIKFLQNRTTPKEMTDVLDWIDAKPENRKYIDHLDKILNASHIWGAKLAATQNNKKPKFTPWRKIQRWTAAAAAVICLGVGTDFLLVNHRMSQITDATQTIHAMNGQRLSITLNDGTLVWLNAGSSLTYPAIFAKQERRVKLDGEAIFEVTHNTKQPFIVETFACDAKVLGTKFDIVAQEQRGVFSATLMEGSLQVTNRTNKETVTMLPNEIIKLQDGGLHRYELTDMDDYLWPEGIINLKGLSFTDLMARLEQAYNVEINIERKTMPTANFSWGKIPVSSGIRHTLQVLQCLDDFKYNIDSETGVITIK